jgi:hypothetical protein
MHATPTSALLVLASASAASALCASQPLQLQPSTARAAPRPIAMAAKKQDGYYRRPSAALEQGGGFYVPGLEGTRLGFAGGSVLSVALLLNRILSPGEPASSQLFSEALGAMGVALIFAQAIVQQRVEREADQDALRAAFASRLKEQQVLADGLSAATAERARWAASTLLKLTPARAVLWAEPDDVLVRFGRFPEGADARVDATTPQQMLAMLGDGSQTAVVDRIDDPPAPLPSNTLSVALCRCGERGVLALASEQPAAFDEVDVQRLSDCARLLSLA